MTSEAAEAPAESSSKKQRKQLPLWQESILLLAMALVLAFVIKAFFLQAFYIPSESMEPGLVVNDRILVQKVSYWGGGSPDRGDVVVFEDPGGWLSSADTAGPEGGLTGLLARVGLYPTGGHLVKRVIGIEGDVITCCDEQGRIMVNGEPLDEPYIKVPGDDAPAEIDCNGPMPGRCNAGEDAWSAGPVPEGHMFVMGDNRAHSDDSTMKMCLPGETDCPPGPEFVDTDLVVGKVFAVVWPQSRWSRVTRPEETFADVPDPS